jgi:glycosyltransferase involved in cell wall biosynthesis
MPVHNEEPTVLRAIGEVLQTDFGHPLELIVVDDGSTDGTALLLSQLDDPRVIVYRHPTNLGKGGAVLTGAGLATGSHLVVFDADCEYRAADLARMLEPIALGHVDVVYGTRLLGMNTVFQSYRYALGNRVTTLAANIMFDANITDLHTCLKMLPLPLFRQLHLTQCGFGLDTEISAELLRRGHRPFEVPVSYMGRSHAQGKKLTWRDGFNCLAVLGRVRLRARVRNSPSWRGDAHQSRIGNDRPVASKDCRHDGLSADSLPSLARTHEVFPPARG